jgi:hypothetical protein
LSHALLWLFFGDEASWSICSVCPWTASSLISASQVAIITGVSHWCPAPFLFWWGRNSFYVGLGYFGFLLKITG